MFRTRCALATLLAVCLLGGCSEDDPEPKVDGDPTPSESPSSATASVSVSPTVTPTAQPQGPRETVDAWLAAWTVALQSGRTEEAEAISHPDCKSCARLITQVADLYAKGGSLDTAGWHATKVSEAPSSTPGSPSFVMQVVESRQVLYDENGSVVDDTPEDTVPMRMTFAQSDEDWLLAKLEILR